VITASSKIDSLLENRQSVLETLLHDYIKSVHSLKFFLVRYSAIDDSPYYVFVALCIVVIVVSLIFKMAYFLS
jgi:hypothetical protein